MLRREFGQLLRELRKEAHMSQEDLAEKLNVSRTTITETENGRNVPKAVFMEQALKLFKSNSKDLVGRYIQIQEDKKELMTLGNMMVVEDYTLAIRLMKHVIRNALKGNDLQPFFSSLFQMIMWDLKLKRKVNVRKSDWLIKAAEYLDPDPESFFDLMDKLYHISRESNNFAAYITITEAIKDKVNLGNKRLSLLLCHQANAYYYSGDPHKAYKKSSKAIDVMNSEVFKHTAFVHHRHAMICLQNSNFDEALEAEHKCLSLLSRDNSLYTTVIQGIARLYYLRENYTQAKIYWEETFRIYGKNVPDRTHSLNDMIMMELKQSNIKKAQEHIKECDRLLTIAKKKDWRFYATEAMLLRRGKVLLKAVESGDFFIQDVTTVLHELKESYLKDEFELTKNFLLEKMFLSGTM